MYIIGSLRSAIDGYLWCFTKQLIENDLAPEIRLSKHLSQETVTIRTEEITRLLKVISDSTDPLAGRDKALFSVYAFSGIRKSEALALKVSDYDNLSKTISLQRSKGSTKKLQSIPSILSGQPTLPSYTGFRKTLC